MNQGRAKVAAPGRDGVSLGDSVEKCLRRVPQANSLNDLFVSAHGFIECMRRAGGERGHAHRTIHDIALSTVCPMAGIDVENDLALDTAGAHDTVLKALSQDMGAVDRPVFRHDEMRIDMGKAPRANGP